MAGRSGTLHLWFFVGRSPGTLKGAQMTVPSRRLGADSPKIPQIPRVAVPRVWPYWDEDADTDAIDTVISDMHGLWGLLAESENTFDDPTFHGPNAEFWIDPPTPRNRKDRSIPPISPKIGEKIRHRPSKLDAFDELDAQLREDDENLGPLESFQLDVPDYQMGDPTIAIANYQFARDRWANLLEKPCWKGVKGTYPSPSVLAVLIREHFGIAATIAVHCLMFESGSPHAVSKKAIEYLEVERRRFVELVAPTYMLFLASLIEQGYWSRRPEQTPSVRSDEPSQSELARGFEILESMGVRNPTRDGFGIACRNAEFAASTKKLGAILRAWRESKK